MCHPQNLGTQLNGQDHRDHSKLMVSCYMLIAFGVTGHKRQPYQYILSHAPQRSMSQIKITDNGLVLTDEVIVALFPLQIYPNHTKFDWLNQVITMSLERVTYSRKQQSQLGGTTELTRGQDL